MAYGPHDGHSPVEPTLTREEKLDAALDELRASEKAYRAAVSELRGRFRAILATRTLPTQGMDVLWLDSERGIDRLWEIYEGDLETVLEILK